MLTQCLPRKEVVNDRPARSGSFVHGSGTDFRAASSACAKQRPGVTAPGRRTAQPNPLPQKKGHAMYFDQLLATFMHNFDLLSGLAMLAAGMAGYFVGVFKERVS